MKFPFATVLILAGQKPKVFTFIAPMAIISPVEDSVLPIIGDVKSDLSARMMKSFRIQNSDSRQGLGIEKFGSVGSFLENPDHLK